MAEQGPPPPPPHLVRQAATLVATGFGAGLLPKAPGTWGSLLALPLAWAIRAEFGVEGLSLAIMILFVVGWWAAALYDRLSERKDPGEVVVDEIVGQWIVLLAAPLEILHYALAFVLFRAADILKPWPVNLADRKMGGGLGIMFDDILAALYALAGMAFAHYLIRLQGG